MYKLLTINENMRKDVYQMYQDIPKEEIGSSNIIFGKTFEEYKQILKQFKQEETIKNEKLNTTTNRYIFYFNNIPIGEIAIRTTLNDFWLNKGSQIFYKIRKSYRYKGHGTKMLDLALKECIKLGMKKYILIAMIKTLPQKE